MRAWAEMFNAFLAGVRRPGRHLAVHRRRLLRPRRRQAAVRRRPRLPRRPRHRPARGRRRRPAERETVRGLGNRKNDAFNEVLERDGVDGLPRLGRAARPPARPRHAARRGLLLGQRAGGAGRGRPRRPVPDRRERGGRDGAGLPGKPAPDTFLHAAECSGATRRDVGGPRGRRVRGPCRRRGRLRGWSSASTAAPAPSTLTRGRRRLVVADLAELVPTGGAA